MKPGRLTEAEFIVMQKHTDYWRTDPAAVFASGVSSGRTDCPASPRKVGWHGLSARASGRQHPEVARIAALADVYDALTTPARTSTRGRTRRPCSKSNVRRGALRPAHGHHLPLAGEPSAPLARRRFRRLSRRGREGFHVHSGARQDARNAQRDGAAAAWRIVVISGETGKRFCDRPDEYGFWRLRSLFHRGSEGNFQFPTMAISALQAACSCALFD